MLNPIPQLREIGIESPFIRTDVASSKYPELATAIPDAQSAPKNELINHQDFADMLSDMPEERVDPESDIYYVGIEYLKEAKKAYEKQEDLEHDEMSLEMYLDRRLHRYHKDRRMENKPVDPEGVITTGFIETLAREAAERQLHVIRQAGQLTVYKHVTQSNIAILEEQLP